MARKAAIAIVEGCVASSAIGAVLMNVLNLSHILPHLSYAWVGLALWFGASFVLALSVASTIGLAWHAFASRNGWTNVHVYWLPGGVVGALLPAILLINAPIVAGIAAAYGALLGALTGFFAWLIRRPDRDRAVSE